MEFPKNLQAKGSSAEFAENPPEHRAGIEHANSRPERFRVAQEGRPLQLSSFRCERVTVLLIDPLIGNGNQEVRRAQDEDQREPEQMASAQPSHAGILPRGANSLSI
jgi:hypothetical protein